jgi:hypothetical protein
MTRMIRSIGNSVGSRVFLHVLCVEGGSTEVWREKQRTALVCGLVSKMKDGNNEGKPMFPMALCFAAGTLVHTREGMKPIEQIQVGDWVLSKPENGEGEQAYKRVTRTIKHENKAVCRVRTGSNKKVGDVYVDQKLIVTGSHPFYVVGQHKEEWWDQEDWDAMPKYMGWRRADWLEENLDMVLLANGETMRVSMVEPIWKTKQEGIGWITGAPDGELGHLIELHDGKISENFSDWIHYGDCVYTDVVDAEHFGLRHETPEIAEQWAYKCDVYNLEVEDFHTYYVGEQGIWVHDTNCYENS